MAERGVEVTDARTFELLREAGTPLDVELEVAAFLYFPNEGAARRAGAALEVDGFTPYVDPSPPSRWVVEAARVFRPTPAAITEMGGKLSSVARANGGQYDGWWAVELEEDGPPPTPAVELEEAGAPPAPPPEPGDEG